MATQLQDVIDYFRRYKTTGFFPLFDGGYPQITKYRYSPQDQGMILEFKSQPQDIYKRLRHLLDLDKPMNIYDSRPNVGYTMLVIGQQSCPYCKELLEILKKKEEKYKFFDMDMKHSHKDIQRVNRISGIASNGYEYIPIVYYKGAFLGGLDETKDFLELENKKPHNQKSTVPFVNRIIKRMQKKKKKVPKI